jgi:hypothetical protein
MTLGIVQILTNFPCLSSLCSLDASSTENGMHNADMDMFTLPLLTTGYLFWINCSGIQPSCHNMFVGFSKSQQSLNTA